MRVRSHLATVSLVATLVGTTSALADVVFTDTNFSDLASYSGPTFTSDAANASINYQQASGTLQFNSVFADDPNKADSVAQGLVNSSFTYDPSVQGAIFGIDASVFKAISNDFPGTGFGNTFHPTIEQNGVFYLANIPGPTFDNPPGSTSSTISQDNLTAADFFAFDFLTGVEGAANPDFAGGSMEFGLTQISGTGGAHQPKRS